MRRILGNAALVCLLLFTPSLLLADDPKDWIGQEVMVRSAQAVLREEPDESSIAATGPFGAQFYTVNVINGSWLQTRRGWLSVNDAIRRDEALAFFTAEIQKTASAFAYASRSCVHSRYWQDEKALADGREAVRLDPKNSLAWSSKGFACSNLGDFDQSIHDYGEANRLDPGFALYFRRRAWARQKKHDFEQALNDASEAIRLDPTDPENHIGRASIHFQCGDLESVLADCEESLRLDPKSANATYLIGRVYSKRRDFAKATERFTEAIRLDPQARDGISPARLGEVGAANARIGD